MAVLVNANGDLTTMDLTKMDAVQQNAFFAIRM